MDRINDLPEDLICIIVSFLSAKSAAFATILSKKWLNLFMRNSITIKPHLVFVQSIHSGEIFKDFVDFQLFSLKPTCRIRRLSLILGSIDNSQYDLVNDCLRNVLKRGVMDLQLDINVNAKEDVYALPFEIFTSKTVSKLKLGYGFVIDILPKNASLPALKTLVLDSVLFNPNHEGCAFTRLLSACTVIDELFIEGLNWEQWKWSRIISSPILKRLMIHREEWEDYVASDSETLSFNTPNLTYLEYFDLLLKDFPVVNLNSLVEAKLVFSNDRYNNKDDIDLTNLIKGLKNVESLSLDVTDIVQLFSWFSEAIPMFENLLRLSLGTEAEVYWEALPILLKRSPNLKPLTIKGSLHYNSYKCKPVCECLLGYSFLLTCSIKVLNITWFGGDNTEMLHLKYVLENLPGLEVLEVRVWARDYDEKLKIMADLLLIPRALSDCKICVKSGVIWFQLE